MWLRGLVGLLFMLLSACVPHQLYDAATGVRVFDCDRIMDAAKRQQCQDDANKPFDIYQREQQGR